MKNKDYKTPIMEVVKIDFSDVITTSGGAKSAPKITFKMRKEFEADAILFDPFENYDD